MEKWRGEEGRKEKEEELQMCRRIRVVKWAGPAWHGPVRQSTTCGMAWHGPQAAVMGPLADCSMACLRHGTTRHGIFNIFSVNLKYIVFYFFIFLLSKKIVKILKVILLKNLQVEKI